MTVRVVFADDNYLVRQGVTGVLAEAAEVDLVESVADQQALHAAVEEHRPDAVLTDILLPPSFTTEGIDVAKRIRAGCRQIEVSENPQYALEQSDREFLPDG